MVANLRQNCDYFNGDSPIPFNNIFSEAIKTADEYFSHNEVEKFVAVFIDMDAATQELLATGLMSPRNVRAMLRNSSEFASQLCNNLSGTTACAITVYLEQSSTNMCSLQYFIIILVQL